MADSTKAKRVKFMQVSPPELRLIILEFAYAVPTARPIIAKGAFGKEHRDLNNAGVVGATNGPFVPEANKFLVSKELFIDAAKAYVKVQTLQEHNTYNYYNQHVGKNLSNMPLFRHFATGVNLTKCSNNSQALGHFQSLKKVEITVYCSQFKFEDYSKQELLTEAQIARLPIAKNLRRLRGLQTITCIAAGTTCSPELKTTWITNVAALEA